MSTNHSLTNHKTSNLGYSAKTLINYLQPCKYFFIPQTKHISNQILRRNNCLWKYLIPF